MVKKIQIIATFEPYEPNEKLYTGASSIEDMAEIDIDQGIDLIDSLLINELEVKLSYKIVDDDLDTLPTNMRKNVIKSIDRNKDAFVKLSKL